MDIDNYLLFKEQKLLRVIVDSSMDAIIAIDENSIIVEYNHYACMLFGFTREQALGAQLEDLIIPKENRDLHRAGMARLKATGKPRILGQRLEMIAMKADGSTVPVELTVNVADITPTLYVACLRDNTLALAVRGRLAQSDELFRAISRASQQYIEGGDVDETFAIFLDEILKLTDSEYGFVSEVLYDEASQPYIRTYAISDIAWNPEMRALYDSMAPNLEFRNLNTLFGSMLLTEELVIANNAAEDPRRGGIPEGHPRLDKFCGIPIRHSGELVGMIGLSNRPGGYDATLVDFLSPFLSACANVIVTWRAERARIKADGDRIILQTAMENARKREDEISAGIQNGLLLRRKPVITPEGLDVGVAIKGFTTVTGDYCDFVTFNDRFDVAVGDVMGKGLTAALVGAAVKGQLHRVVRRLHERTVQFGRHPQPQEIASALQAVLTPQLIALNSFVTLAYAAFERRNTSLSVTHITVVDAGHTPILRIRAGAEPLWLIGDNVPFGLAMDEHYTQTSYVVAPGDTYLMFSDGVTEATNAFDVPLGKERFAQIAMDLTLKCHDAEDLANQLAEKVMDYTGDRVEDDITIVAVRIAQQLPHNVARSPKAFYEVEATADTIPQMLRYVEDYMQRLGIVPSNDQHSVLIGIAEVLNNIVEHGILSRKNQQIQLEIQARTTDIEVIICDYGRHYKPPLKPQINLFNENAGGFGWWIIYECFNEVELIRNPLNYNTLRLVRKTGLH